MFTGIVEELGRISAVSQNKLAVECVTVIEDAKLGDSIAVNGVCLTVVEILACGFVADISSETLKVTNLGSLKNGDAVNLERAMKVDGRFGGHIVSGHIDGLAKVLELKPSGEFYELKCELDNNLAKYVISKGSVTVNGISLTVVSVDGNCFKIAIIPHTFEKTNLKNLKISDFVNIEVDMVAKYVEKFLLSSDNKSRISLEFLQENGF